MAKKSPKDETTTEPQTGNAPCNDCPRTLPQPDYDKARLDAYERAANRIELNLPGLATKRTLESVNSSLNYCRDVIAELRTRLDQINNLDPKVLAKRESERARREQPEYLYTTATIRIPVHPCT